MLLPATVRAHEPGDELRRGAVDARTVTHMSIWYIGNGTLSFVIPTRADLEHAAANDTDNDIEIECGWDVETETGWWLPADTLDDGTCDTDVSYVVPHRIWWWSEAGCDGVACACGRLTLLEVLQRLSPDERGDAIKLHADEMRMLFDHFWGGQGLVSGVSKRIGNACPDCLIEGAAHVWDVYENAGLLAEEFGEALAAYAYELFVGEPRYVPPRPDAPAA